MHGRTAEISPRKGNSHSGRSNLICSSMARAYGDAGGDLAMRIYATKHPVLLPCKHPITTLIVQEAHSRVQHNGIKETLTET